MHTRELIGIATGQMQRFCVCIFQIGILRFFLFHIFGKIKNRITHRDKNAIAKLEIFSRYCGKGSHHAVTVCYGMKALQDDLLLLIIYTAGTPGDFLPGHVDQQTRVRSNFGSGFRRYLSILEESLLKTGKNGGKPAVNPVNGSLQQSRIDGLRQCDGEPEDIGMVFSDQSQI